VGCDESCPEIEVGSSDGIIGDKVGDDDGTAEEGVSVGDEEVLFEK